MWGVIKTLGSDQSGDVAGSGSSAVTSMAAAQILLPHGPDQRLLVGHLAAPTLTNTEEGFMAAKAAALIRPSSPA